MIILLLLLVGTLLLLVLVVEAREPVRHVRQALNAVHLDLQHQVVVGNFRKKSIDDGLAVDRIQQGFENGLQEGLVFVQLVLQGGDLGCL